MGLGVAVGFTVGLELLGGTVGCGDGATEGFEEDGFAEDGFADDGLAVGVNVGLAVIGFKVI